MNRKAWSGTGNQDVALGTSWSLLVGPLAPEDYPSPVFSTLGRKVVDTRDEPQHLVVCPAAKRETQADRLWQRAHLRVVILRARAGCGRKYFKMRVLFPSSGTNPQWGYHPPKARSNPICSSS